MPHFAWALPTINKNTPSVFSTQHIMNSFIMVSWHQMCSFPCWTHPVLSFSLKKSSPLHLRLFISMYFTLHRYNSKLKGKILFYILCLVQSTFYITEYPAQTASSILLHMPMQVQQWRSDAKGCHNSFKNKQKWNLQTQKQGTSTVIISFTYLVPLNPRPPLSPPLLNGFPCVVWSLL